MAKRESISGTLTSVDTSKRELTLEEDVFAFEAEPAVEYKSYSYELDADWDEDRIIRAVGEHVLGTAVDGVVKQLHLA